MCERVEVLVDLMLERRVLEPPRAVEARRRLPHGAAVGLAAA